ncbi:IS600 ORF1 [Shigella sonnei]|nr:IS600 ORF1 [Shigella sonnei]
MSRKTQRYSKEFKAEAVRTVPENQLSISEGASRLSLPEGTLGQWVTAARKGLGTPGSRTVAELDVSGIWCIQERLLQLGTA